MKNLILTLLICSALCASGQSDRKINRLSKETALHVRAALTDSTDGFFFEKQLYCEETLVTHFVNNRHFIAHSSRFILDLSVKKRKVGEYDSWIAVDNDGRWYFITPFRAGTESSFGVIVQPISKKLQRQYDIPTIIIANFNLCQ